MHDAIAKPYPKDKIDRNHYSRAKVDPKMCAALYPASKKRIHHLFLNET